MQDFVNWLTTNPVAQYTLAVTEHKRGAHDAAGRIIHDTPKEKRREYAREIWSRRRERGTDRRDDVPF